MAMTAETRAPGRPRSEDADRAILDATIDSLVTDGFSGTTMAGIARAAGVSTATLYRRWSCLTEVVVAALARLRSTMEPPDTGSLDGDLRELARMLVQRLTRTRETALLSALIDQTRRDPDLALAISTSVFGPTRQAIGDMFRRGVVRGEVDPDVDVDLAIDLVLAPMYLRGLATGRRYRPADADRLAALVLRAVART